MKNHVKGRGEEAPPGVGFSDISVLYRHASSSVTEGAPKYWLALRARREVTDAAWSGVSEWDLVRCASSGHYRRVRWGGLCLGGALNFVCTKHHFRRG